MKRTKSSMEMLFLILVCLLGGLRETEAEMSVTGVSGEAVTIKCSHANAYTNIKYFCKGACENKDVLISSRKKTTESSEKYSISDEGNTFYVTISHLTEDDSGTYWCAIERVGLDTYNKVVLTVIQGNTEDSDKDFTKESSSEKLLYIGAGLGVAVLALAMVLLIFFIHRSRDISASSGKVHDTVCATPLSQKRDSHHTTAANEEEETGGTGRDHTNDIYSNVTVSSEPNIQPDGLFYSTVIHNKQTDCSTVTPGTAEVTYSTIKNTTTDESTVYCNV